MLSRLPVRTHGRLFEGYHKTKPPKSIRLFQHPSPWACNLFTFAHLAKGQRSGLLCFAGFVSECSEAFPPPKGASGVLARPGGSERVADTGAQGPSDAGPRKCKGSLRFCNSR
jgi:hypothetical protein